MKEMLSARELAFGSMISIEKNRRYPNIEVDTALRDSGLGEADRGLYTRLVYGVTEKKMTLDWIISGYSKMPPEELDGQVLCALRMGIYQISYMDRIPEYSAVNETVGLVAKKSRGYVNGVLRSFIRAGCDRRLPEGDGPVELSVRYSVSEKLAGKLISVYGKDAGKMLSAMEKPSAVGLRVNTLKISAEEALKLLPQFKISPLCGNVISGEELGQKAREGIEKGLWYVEDPSSALAASAVGAMPGELVIDTCACPGGKSFSMAMDMQNSGRILSLDIHANKLSLIERGAGKLGISIIETGQRDGRDPIPEYVSRADRVLCDAPCSGIGVMGKKPDIRYKDPDEFAKLPRVQREILEGASGYVRKGGTLVYSTCTVLPEENGDVVRDFLASHPEFAPDSGQWEHQFLPHADGCDGFYFARMKRIT